MDMDQFNVPHQRVKEKSVYMLNLDAPRIVIIAAAVVGIIIVSFLLGMNFIKGGDGAKTLMTKNDIFGGKNNIDLLRNNLPDASDEDELSKPADEKLVPSDKDLAVNKDLSDIDKHPGDRDKSSDAAAVKKNETSDLLTGDNIRESDEPDMKSGKKAARTADAPKKISKSSYSEKAYRPVRKSPAKNIQKKARKDKSSVVAVSGGNTEHVKTAASGDFTIQVASFDRKTRAQAEVKALTRMNYDAYLDETTLNGKQYFRVRIGHIASKKKALELLEGIQSNDRYRESYMVRE